ncbi:MAG: DUF3108 domain-containing protein [bacterium]|nr:DUF3108 domain-containing protein [bacterium]
MNLNSLDTDLSPFAMNLSPMKQLRGIALGFRRHILFGAAILLGAALLAPCAAVAGKSLHAYPPSEEFRYDIRFLFLTKVAEGVLRIRRLGGNRYKAELSAETRGLAGFLSSYQKNFYISELEYQPGSGHLLARVFTKIIQRGGVKDESRTVIDHEKREIRWKTFKNGELRHKGSEKIPPGLTYEDPLSAFFNFRAGFFGQMKRGLRRETTTIPAYQTDDKGNLLYNEEFVRNFKIRVADAATEQKYRTRFERTRGKGLVVIVNVPKSLFGQKTGEVQVYFDASSVPVAVIVENAIFFGDVYGVLQQAAKPR